jgi:hypothetical protein
MVIFPHPPARSPGCTSIHKTARTPVKGCTSIHKSLPLSFWLTYLEIRVDRHQGAGAPTWRGVTLCNSVSRVAPSEHGPRPPSP